MNVDAAPALARLPARSTSDAPQTGTPRRDGRMDALGRLAAGIAYEFNNYLTVMAGFFELLQPVLGDQQPAADYLSAMRGASCRAAGLVGSLIAFSRRQCLQPARLDLNEIVTRLWGRIEQLVGEAIDVRMRLGSGHNTVHGDERQVERAILNLALNARDAMPGGGRLLIETGNAALGEAEAAATAVDVPPGFYGTVSFTDTGAGLDRTEWPHVFEPYFSTRETGHGMGLGLAVAWGIARQSGGFLTVVSEPAQGSTFTVHFPRSAAGRGTSESAAWITPPPLPCPFLSAGAPPGIQASEQSLPRG